MTKYAKGILEIIENSYSHPTAEEIFLEMKKKYPKVVLATIYNNLNSLVAEGCIRKITLMGSPDRYDRLDRHDHLVCQKCGKLSDIRLRDYSEEIADKLGGGILSYDLKVFYYCEDCQ
ncbi:MAG: transcriptional repressor [Eubacteriaceae bacterium]|nr:transcriptional repressor [Eubacteriaceae bacterium]